MDAVNTPRSPLLMANVMRSIAVPTSPGPLSATVLSDFSHQEMLSSPKKEQPEKDARILEDIEYDKMASAEGDEVIVICFESFYLLSTSSRCKT
jgi:hypothetical protein